MESSLRLVRGLQVLRPDGDIIAVASEQGERESGAGDETPEEEERLVVVTCRALRFATAAWISQKAETETKIWCGQSGKCLLELAGHEEVARQASSLAFSSNGTHLVAGFQRGAVQVWCAETGASLLSLKGDMSRWDSLCSVSFSPDSRKVVTGSWRGTVNLWCLGTAALLWTQQAHNDQVRSASFSSNGERILTASYDGVAKLWCSTTGRCLRVFDECQCSFVMAAVFAPQESEGVMLLTACDGCRSLSLWRSEPERGALRRMILRPPSECRVVMALFSANCECVLIRSSDGATSLWCAQRGKCLCAMWLHEEKEKVRSVALSPDGAHVLVGISNGTTRVWSVTTQEEEKQPVCFFSLECGGSVDAVAYESGGGGW